MLVMSSPFLCLYTPTTSFPSLPTTLKLSSSSFHTYIPSLKSSLTQQQHHQPFFKHKTVFYPFTTSKTKSYPSVKVKAQLNFPLIPPQDHWGTFSVLFATAAFGIWSDTTKIGCTVSGAVVSTLGGLAASNLGIISNEAPAYSVVMEYLLPITIPLLLFKADLGRVVQSTGKMLLAFLLGSVATIIGTIVAYRLVPMRSLGQDSWKIAAALMSSYIGGTINFVAVSEALGVSPSVLAAGIAADNVVCAIYFALLFTLASKIPPEVSTSANDSLVDTESIPSNKLPVLGTAGAIAVSFGICKIATYLTQFLGLQGGNLPFITAIVVIAATIFPAQFRYLAPAGEATAFVLMQAYMAYDVRQVFFTVVGANGSIWNVIHTAPSIFVFALIQVSVHLAVIFGVGKLLHFDTKVLLLASNANIGGPTTACGMATNKGWTSLALPAILIGIFGISIATFLGIGFGLMVLKSM
ncbi:hypothetical protein IFM89_026545 [Coptis chinensis]|uniref:Membrane protein YjcL n=1 Tax=Coptis chinensis TaxID=261450 RepID=A0A835HMV6_9MAGN|nr:hypothetical protein IFM89_026545 [Coptis chinensis]